MSWSNVYIYNIRVIDDVGDVVLLWVDGLTRNLATKPRYWLSILLIGVIYNYLEFETSSIDY